MADFNYIANVKCVNDKDTWIEFLFPNYQGNLSEDVTAISIIGPNGSIANQKDNFHSGRWYLPAGIDVCSLFKN